MCPWVSAEKIIELNKTKDAEFFCNFVLGLPYVGSDNKVDDRLIYENIIDGINKQKGRIVIGVDTGLGIHVVVGNQEGIFYQSSTNDYEDFEMLMRRFPNAIAVFDAHGDLHKPRELKEKYKGRMFLCYYAQDRKTNQLIRWGKKGEEGVVSVDRNRMIQLIIDEMKSKRISFWGKKEDWYDLAQHFKNIVRREQETNLGTMKRVWDRTGPDHLVHAMVYWRIGMSRFGQGGVQLLGNEQPIEALQGMKIGLNETVEASAINQRKNETYDWRLT